MAADITISIVNTNNRDLACQCLTSVYETAGDLDLEVFVVNNACTDGSTEAIRERFPQVKIIENREMLGFSTNNNLVFARATGRYLMLLNDDTIVQPGAFQAMVAFMDAHPEAAVVGASLLNPDGSLQQSYDHSPHPLHDALRPVSEFLRPVPSSRGVPLEVGCVCGACMMVRASAVETVGLLDTQFDPLYSEEVDWCFRFQKVGGKVYHLPSARVIHLGGQTMSRAPLHRVEQIYEKKALFFRKHYGIGTVATYKVALLVSNLLKSLSWLALRCLGRDDALMEFRAHWNLTKKALFF